MVHAGSVTAASPDLALIYAQGGLRPARREQRAVGRCRARRSMVLDDSDILHPVLGRAYRLVEGYRMREKLQAVQERLKSDESD